MNLLATGNSKLGNDIFSFSLPITGTCKPSKWCSANCYAKKPLFQFQQALYKRNFNISKFSYNFVDLMIREINKRKINKVRIHVSGDFYNARYIDSWASIIWYLSEVQFKVFTKRIDLLKPITEAFNPLENVFVHFSIDDSTTKRTYQKVKRVLPLAVIEGSKYEKDLDPTNTVYCAGKCHNCGYTCWNKDLNVILRKH